jgi:type VI secretion system protein
MNQGLFESLTGHFLNGEPVDSIDVRGRRTVSIMDHLNRLFNTREGSLSHLQNYGLPDISEIYRKMPDGIDDLIKAIQITVEKYEPRLKNVKVMRREDESDKFKLVLIVSGEFREGGRVRFQTTFTSTGNSSIVPYKKPE